MKKSFVLSLFVVNFFIVCSLKSQTYTQDLVAFYPFNNSLSDITSFGNNAIETNVTFVEDRNSKPFSSAYFNGNAKLEILDAPQLKLYKNLTISFWIKPDNNKVQNLFSRTKYTTANNAYYGMSYGLSTANTYSYGEGVSLWVNDTRDCRYNDNWTRFSTNQNVNSWTFVTAVISNASAKLYINGILNKEKSLKIDSISNCGVSDFIFGANWSGDTRNFYGAIDDIKIYKKGLSSDEVLDQYSKNDLVAYYPLNGDFNDKTDYQNHATSTEISFVNDNCNNDKVAYFNGTSSVSS